MDKQNKIRKSLRFSFLEGAFSSSMSGFTNDYITPYALALKATIRQIGVLSALPFFALSLTQLIAADITEKLKSRKKTISIFAFLNALMLVPVMLIPYQFNRQPVLFLIIFMTMYTGFNALTSPAMSALLSDYIPSRMRGKYFGWRNKIMSIILIACSLIAGLILQFFKSSVLKGFFIIFGVASLSRFISWYFVRHMYDPGPRFRKEARFSFLDFVRGARKSNFGRFVLLISGLQFCVNIAAPFFSVFMLKDLKFSYITYTIIVSTVIAVQILTIGRWGRIADKVGNIRVIKFTALLISSLPLWWLVSHNPVFLFFAQTVSGFAWSGFNLSTANFIYDAVTPQKRVRCIAYFSVFVSLAVFCGGIIGGYLANALPNIFGYRILTLFFLASILRFLVVFLLSDKLKEVRETEKINIKDMVYSVIGIRPI